MTLNPVIKHNHAELEFMSIKFINQKVNVNNIIKQEAHGPHPSPEKTVQINKHI